MDLPRVLEELLNLGKSDVLANVIGMPGAGVHHDVVLFSTFRERIITFASQLSPKDQAAFVKAVAAYEDTVGGIGSVTLLRHLLPILDDPERNVLDWVLRNTRSYWYYSPSGAKSLEEHNAGFRGAARYRADRAAQEQTRQADARAAKISRATECLPNAVRRGDLLAIKALIKKGADSSLRLPDGRSLADLARTTGREDIVAMLESRPSPSDNTA
jgi:hypothetical protein